MEPINEVFLNGWCLVSSWIAVHYIELLATITGFIYILYSIKGDKRLWVYGFISSSLSIVLAKQSGIYADIGIYAYYVLVSIYGWVHWTFYRNKRKKEIPITKANIKTILLLSFATSILYLIIYLILTHFTDSSVAHRDAFTTSASVIGTWMLVRKILENWIVFFIVDIVSINLYISKSLMLYSFLYLAYTILAVVGFIQWRKQWSIQEKE